MIVMVGIAIMVNWRENSTLLLEYTVNMIIVIGNCIIAIIIIDV